MMVKMSQESHLLSPEISAAGSDNGHVDDLKGESFSDLAEVENNHNPLAKEAGAAVAAGATPSSHRQQQQTSLKTPAAASPANPGTHSNTTTTTNTTSKSKSKSKSKSDPSQTTRKQGKSKSNTAKMISTKSTLSTSRRPTPINIQIVRVDSSSPQSSQSTSTSHKTNGPAHSFAMNMLPMTKIRELCLHASAHARRHLDLVLDGSRFEARDRDGHVFRGHETISEEILKGETIYLIEAGLDARGPARAGRGSSSSRAGSERPKGGGGARERGRLLCLKSLELEGEERETRAPYRTPSVSSRASSSQEASRGKSEPRLTPSQKALAIAQMGRTPATQELVIKKRRPVSSAVKKTLPSPVLEKVGQCSDAEAPGDETLVGELDEGDDLERTLVAASPLRISTPPPSSPKQQHDHHQQVPPNLQDSQLVIPDSQDPFSQGLFSQEPVESQQPAPTPSLPDMPDAPRAQPRPSPRVKAAPTTATTQARQPTSRPDPYDINTVLTDDEDERSDESNNTHTNVRMAPSVRKLGSATTQRKTVAPPPVSLPSPRRAQSNPPSPSRANRAGVPAAGSKTSTPAKKATPVKVGHSSPAVPLPSSPTTHVAAAIAKGGQRPVGRNRTPQLPSPGQIVLRVPSDSDEDDDLIEEAFRDLSRSYPPPSLPWSQPPLRVALDAEAGGDDQPARRRGSVGSAAGEARGGTLVAAALPSASGSPRKSPLKKPLPPSPSKQLSHRSPIKSSPIITSPSKREEATIVHDSSSAVESDEDQDFRIVKKEIRNEESPSRKTRLADIPAIDKKPQQEEKKQHEVIELSSGSDSDIEPSEDILEEEEEEDELKLPTIDVELPVQEAKVPPLSLFPARIGRSPLRDSPKTDPIKIEPAYEEPPPSAQASKRKRDTSEEPDPEDEKHRRKRVKREARKARRARDRGQKASMLLQEEREEQLAALQEERKKLALEKAHRRALELEIIVSSPVKREPSIELSSEEGDDENDSGLGSSANGNETSADVDGAGVPMDGDDKNDSLSSKEAGDNRLSWRKLSKPHLSSPRKSSQDGPGEDSLDHLGVPPTSTPAIIEAQLQQCIEERFHRMPFDDWAFLENTLGHGPSGGYGHSALEVHHRVHLDMTHRAQHLPPHHTSATEEPTSASDEPQDEPRTPSGPTDRAGGDDAPARAQSQRSDAPSPKEQGARPQDKTKPVPKLRQERDRKRERRRRANGPYHHNFRNSHVGSWKMKQRQGRNGH